MANLYDVLFEGLDGAPIDNSAHAVTAAVFKNAGLSALQHGVWRERILPELLREHLRRSNTHRNLIAEAKYKRFIKAHLGEARYTNLEVFKPKSIDRAGHERVLAEWFVENQSRHKLVLDSVTIAEESRKAYCLDFANEWEPVANSVTDQNTSAYTRSELIGLEQLVRMRQDEEPDQDPETVRQSLLRHLNRRRKQIKGKTDRLPSRLYRQGPYLRSIYITSIGDKDNAEYWEFKERGSFEAESSD